MFFFKGFKSCCSRPMSVIQNYYYLHKVPTAVSIMQLQVAISVSSFCA